MASEKSDEVLNNAQNGTAGAAKKSSTPNKRKVLLADRDRFVRTLMQLYTGQPIERKTLIFKM